ncbi:MAG: TVP38/TMEM64 family protein [Clostridium sp.]|uniref:TVP38/TMEM64 family protein n=1 Tax=Clostridium sp. TaxID=1506 RepID=UPI003EE4EC44
MTKAKSINLIKFLTFIAILGVSMVFLIKNKQFFMHLNVEEIVNFAKQRNTRIYAMIVIIIIFILKPIFVIIPNSLIAVIDGFIFGYFKGFVITLIGYFITSTVGFYLARFLGKGFIESIVGNKLNNIEKKLKKNQFIIILSLRLIPILPLGPLNYACGLTNVPYKKFIIATLIGVVPEIICYISLGKNVDRPTSPAFFVPSIILVGILILSKFIIKKVNK